MNETVGLGGWRPEAQMRRGTEHLGKQTNAWSVKRQSEDNLSLIIGPEGS